MVKIEKMDWVISYEIFVFKNIIDKIRSDVLCSNNTPTSSFSRRETRFPFRKPYKIFKKLFTK